MGTNQSTGAATEIEMGVTQATSDESLFADQWVLDIEARARNREMESKEVHLWQRASIYKVPDYKKELNPKAFTPVLVSFGPFHHDNPQLKKMKIHKERALVQFLQKTNQSLQNIIDHVAGFIRDLRDAYYPLDDRWKTNDKEFLKMMVLDGYFTLELLQRLDELIEGSSNESFYSNRDPYFSRHAIKHKWSYIRRDMLLIENQLPFLLLKIILFRTRRYDGDINHYIDRLVLNLVAKNGDRRTVTGWSRHALDLFRKSLLGSSTPQPSSEPHNGPIAPTPHSSLPIYDDYARNSLQTQQPAPTNTRGNTPQTQPELNIIRCAVELDEAGVRFKKGPENNLKEIKFESGKFHLPFLKVDDTTECCLLNVITFEYLQANLPPDVTIYITIMDEIIDSANDVRLLCNEGLILNALGSDEEVAHIFNSMGKDITMHHDDHLSEVRKNVCDYCRKRRHRWRAYLIRTYFKNPWTVISLAGALLVIALTIAQTVYASFQK